MDIMQFIEKYLGEHENKGGKDIKIKKCPFCGSEDYKFLINPASGRWVCNHKNRCGEQGGINKLKLKFGIKASFTEMTTKPDNDDALTYTKEQQLQFSNLSQEQIDFFLNRGITIETLKKNRIANRKGVIAFPYFKDGNLMTFKFRTVKEKKFYQEGGKPVLFGYDDITTDEPIVIVEGEMDMLTFKECGINNVVSVPFGAADLRWIDYCWDKLEKCNSIVLCFDNDKAGTEAVSKVKERLGNDKLSYINTGTYKDINEMLMQEGETAVVTAYKNMITYNVDGCYDVSDIDLSEDENEAYSSIETIDNILHGFRKKELTIWTGEPGSGKSTMLNQIILETIEQGGKVAIFSGEVDKTDLLKWIIIQCYGKDGCELRAHKIGKGKYYYPKTEFVEMFKNDFKGKLFIMEDNSTMNTKSLFEKMKYYSMKKGVDRFIVDNIMQLDFNSGNDKDKYGVQKTFIANCVDFCKKNNCHIDVVAHPKKPLKGEQPSMYDIHGASEIANLAFNIIRLRKVGEEEAKEHLEKGSFNFPVNGIAYIQKNRRWGKTEAAGLMFDSEIMRFYSNTEEYRKIYKIGKEEELNIEDALNFFTSTGEVV